MLLDLAEASGAVLDSDVCVIGAGAAGITLALALASRKLSVVLAEAGGLEFEARSQDCYAGRVVGDDYDRLDAARLRYFGGTTNHWGGVCAPLAPHDFIQKAGIADTAWPIGHDAIAPYLAEARGLLQVAEGTAGQAVLGGDFLRLDVRAADDPHGFSARNLPHLRGAPDVRLILNANLVGLDQDGRRVAAARFADYDGHTLLVRARHVVMACGGIENARLLLALNAAHGTGFGTPSGTLGRYFTEHPHGDLAEVVVARPELLGRTAGLEPEEVAHFAPSPELIGSAGLLNIRLKLKEPPAPDGAARIIRDIACVAPQLAMRIARAAGGEIACAGVIGCLMEQAPLKENRIELAQDTDRFGLPRPTLHWRRGAVDRRSARDAILHFARLMAERDVGRVKVAGWVVDDGLPVVSGEGFAARHHIGATRMAASADGGVVDTDARVFGTDNLFIAGSSVFPSCGHANPTLPLVALALRLADHISTLSR